MCDLTNPRDGADNAGAWQAAPELSEAEPRRMRAEAMWKRPDDERTDEERERDLDALEHAQAAAMYSPSDGQ